MALIVEDGTGIASAESYADLATFKAYRSRGGLTIPAGADDATLEAALIRGSAAVDGLFGSRFPGFRATTAQGLEWPRAGAWDRDGLFGSRFPGSRATTAQGLEWPRAGAWDRDGLPLVGLPPEVSRAACEAALIELSSPGVLSKKEERGLRSLKVGPIEKAFGPAGATLGFPILRQTLGRILGASGARFSRG